MRPGGEIDRRAAALAAARTPYVRAIVVRARRPASARPGDTAVVLEDGRIEGFVGGECAQATVRLHSLRALADGEPLLLRISPDTPADPEAAAARPHDGALEVANPCLSGGELEIFLEPVHPAPLFYVFGETPIGRALVALGPTLDYDIRTLTPSECTPEALGAAAAVVVASHGGDEHEVLVRAARSGVPYIALVSSPKRGRAVLAGLDLESRQRERIRNPAGLWIGARTPGEVALSILAEFIAAQRGVAVKSDGSAPHEHDPHEHEHGPHEDGAPAAVAGGALESAPGPEIAVDPVCGMTVAVAAGTPFSDAAGERRWFCRTGCREAFEVDPAAYAGHR